jgi:hypothetical protein
VAVEVRNDAVEVIGDERAARASRVLLVDPVAEAEHEVVDEQLGAAVEEISKALGPISRLEDVLILDRDPGQLLPPARQLIAPSHVFLLGREQLFARRQPFLARSRLWSVIGLLLSVATSR